MELKIITDVYLNNSKELLLILEGGGKSMYQHVYRSASGVYWDNKNGGFKSSPITDWSCSQWFFHILASVSSELDVQLVLGKNINWQNVPEIDITKIVQQYVI